MGLGWKRWNWWEKAKWSVDLSEEWYVNVITSSMKSMDEWRIVLEEIEQQWRRLDIMEEDGGIGDGWVSESEAKRKEMIEHRGCSELLEWNLLCSFIIFNCQRKENYQQFWFRFTVLHYFVLVCMSHKIPNKIKPVVVTWHDLDYYKGHKYFCKVP